MDENQRVLVIGATQGTGYLIVNLLLRDGYQVRALARNETKAKEKLSSPVGGHLLAKLEGSPLCYVQVPFCAMPRLQNARLSDDRPLLLQLSWPLKSCAQRCVTVTSTSRVWEQSDSYDARSRVLE
jgi:NAD(P)-dependent dehydrogenase (short-subunit alcohol dehydrogenase family)